ALEGLGDVAMAVREPHPFQVEHGRLLLRRPHVGPYHACLLDARVGGVVDLVFEAAFGRLVRHVDAAPDSVEFPAVVDAAEATLLVSAEEEGRAAVRTVGAEQADPALRV